MKKIIKCKFCNFIIAGLIIFAASCEDNIEIEKTNDALEINGGGR